MHYKKILLLVAVMFTSRAVMAVPFAFETRSLGMGNVRTATADIATAPFANPAMLSFQPSREDFQLVLGAGGFLADNDGLVDKIDSFQNAYDAGDSAGALNIAQSMTGDIIAPEVTLMFSTGFSGDKWSFAFSARSDAIAAGTVTTTDPNDPNAYTLEIEGILTSELGISVARNFHILGQKVSVGLKPKMVQVESVSYAEAITTVDTGISDLLKEENRSDLGDFITADLGLVMGITEHTQVGLLLSNLVSHKIKFIDPATSGLSELSFDMQARLGAAYRTHVFTIGADIDLLENDALLTNPNFQALKTQQLSLGAEFNALDFLQLRVGAQKNIANGIPEAAKDMMYTAGVGLWFGFNVDLALVSQNDSFGGFVQTGFRF